MKERIERAIEKAREAFEAVLVAEFPEATSGDVTPLTAHAYSEATEAMMREWVELNVKVTA